MVMRHGGVTVALREATQGGWDDDALPSFPVALEWQQWAACSLETSTLFDALEQGEDPESERVLQAKGICATCPVQLECAELAVETGDPGVWAGVLVVRKSYEPTPRPARVHGTPAARKRHRKLGEPVCDVCEAAAVEAVRRGHVQAAATRSALVRADPNRKHGTKQARVMHRKMGEPYCAECVVKKREGPKRRVVEHGTEQARLQHRRAGELLCAPCWASVAPRQQRALITVAHTLALQVGSIS